LRVKGAIALLPLLPDGSTIFEKQYKYTINDWMIEVPARTLDEHESAEEREECVKRGR